KMSKSLGNTKSVDFVLKKWGPNVIRLFCLSGHYSKPIDYSEDALKEIITKWRQVENCYYELILSGDETAITEDTKFIEDTIKETKKEFDEALSSDFNTPLATSAFFKLVKATNQTAASERLVSSISKMVLPALDQMLDILGLKVSQVTLKEKNEINELIDRRNLLRSQKNFQDADIIRKKISDMGVVLIDHKKKTLWMKQEKIGAEN
ncbi:MAG: cysteine--tRNA ligase, partial [Thaumarchaeota archaeon]|nr:cysteine--tRNA ligase [Nitrososphaerota archaeon]